MFNLLLIVMLITQIVPNSDKVQLSDAYTLQNVQSESDVRSNYFSGSILVHVIFPESTGELEANQEDWTTEEILQHTQEISNALDWYASIYTIAHITYILDVKVVPTKYEIAVNPNYSDEWLHDVLHTANTWDSAYIKMDSIIAEDQEVYDNSFFLFIVRNDSTHSYTRGSQGYAYLNGPYALVNTWPNTRVESTIAHELGHIFGALDQYPAARQGCTMIGGVYDTPNKNTDYENCGTTKVSSIMKNSVGAYIEGAIDLYAREQMGVKDDNCNGVIDYIEVDTTNVCRHVYIPLAAKE